MLASLNNEMEECNCGTFFEFPLNQFLYELILVWKIEQRCQIELNRKQGVYPSGHGIGVWDPGQHLNGARQKIQRSLQLDFRCQEHWRGHGSTFWWDSGARFRWPKRYEIYSSIYMISSSVFIYRWPLFQDYKFFETAFEIYLQHWHFFRNFRKCVVKISKKVRWSQYFQRLNFHKVLNWM